MKTLLISACTAALLLSAGAASAQTGPRAQGLDTDRDGRVSQAEFLSRLDRMAAADTNRDGSITPDERGAAMQARVVHRRDSAFDRLDANDDGAVSREEFSARAEQAPRARMARQTMRRMAARRGAMARASVRTERTVDLAQARERMSQAFARLDKDGDGYLTAEERRDGAMERRQNRREMRRPSPTAATSE